MVINHDESVKRYYDANDTQIVTLFELSQSYKHSKYTLIGLLSHVCSGPKVMLFHASMKRMTLGLWYHYI